MQPTSSTAAPGTDGIVYDVVIVGAGVSGGIVASELAAKNLNVLIIEAGQPIPASRQDYMERFFTSPAKLPEAPYPPNPINADQSEFNVGRATTNDLANVRDQSKSYLVQNLGDNQTPFTSTYERAGGGTLWHWLGTSLRLLPGDFELKSKFGHGRDWPIPYDSMAPLYARAETEMGVACTVETQQYMDGLYPPGYQYPMPSIKQSYLDKTLQRSLAGVQIYGEPMNLAPTPAARNSRPYQGRRVCAGNTNCIPICPIEAKYDATVTINKALTTGKVTILYRTVASRVNVDPLDGKISGIDYITWTDPRGGASGHGTAVGKFYVLAAHAIETPRLLLMSADDRMPNGVANSSGQVGRNLMDHPLYLSWALMPEDKPIYPMRGPISTSGIETLRDTAHRRKWAAFRMEIGNEGWNFPINDPYQTPQDYIDGTNVSQLNPKLEKLHGTALVERLNKLFIRQFRIANLVEEEANPSSRVSLSWGYQDRLGLPRPLIDYRLSEYTRKGFKKARKVNSAIYKAVGATEYTVTNTEDPTYFEVDGEGFNYFGAGHIMGTTVMGSSRADSVVDSDQRCWDHDNLYIVGSSTFPATGTANPTLTIAALSFKTADILGKRLSK
ncbi:choline dehydrogenase-like flavoprotein [Skermanella aerolata]|uniref:GMC family oxidoreductase n=1 Tax=Skermanella aerolata TaxID=393310 RepID=UPI003D23C528